jgi:hypothetical protein
VLSQKNLALPQLLFTITVYGIPASFLIFFITACLVVPKGRPSKGDDFDDKPPFGDSGLDTLALYGNTANIIPDNPEHYNIL